MLHSHKMLKKKKKTHARTHTQTQEKNDKKKKTKPTKTHPVFGEIYISIVLYQRIKSLKPVG